MSTIAQTAVPASDTDDTLQVVKFGVVLPDARRRMALYINRSLFVASANTPCHETKFHKLPNGSIVADQGVADDKTIAIVEGLEYFVRHLSDRYTGLRILEACNQPAFTGGTKCVFRLGSGHTVEALLIYIAKELDCSYSPDNVTIIESDTPSELENEDAIRDADIPFYNVRH